MLPIELCQSASFAIPSINDCLFNVFVSIQSKTKTVHFSKYSFDPLNVQSEKIGQSKNSNESWLAFVEGYTIHAFSRACKTFQQYACRYFNEKNSAADVLIGPKRIRIPLMRANEFAGFRQFKPKLSFDWLSCYEREDVLKRYRFALIETDCTEEIPHRVEYVDIRSIRVYLWLIAKLLLSCQF